MAQVSVERIVKTFGTRSKRVRALDGVSLAVDDGSFVVLVGPSGCGKTTLLRVIAGLDAPDEGNVRIGHRVVNNVAPKDRDVAMVFQHYALYPHMSVYKNMAFGLKMRGVPRGEVDTRVRAVSELVGLNALLDRRPGLLSGGEQQRVALGRAIVREPAAFLLDEPLSNLDVTLRAHLRAELRALHQRLRATVIHVTHDQEEAMTLGDRVAVMNHGRVHQFGAPMDVYARPADRFVAGFIGRPGMRFLLGRVESQDGAIVFRGCDNVRVSLPKTHRNIDGTGSSGDMVLGIRAEHVRLNRSVGTVTGSSNGLVGVVSLVEPMGDRTYVHATLESGDKVVARTEPFDAPRPGDKVSLTLDPTGLHLFSPGPDGTRIGGSSD